MNIQGYCDILNIALIVRYYPNQNGRWCAHFDNCEFKDKESSSVLSSTHGNGNSPDAAIEDYLRQIRGKWMIVHAMSVGRRREYQVPHSLGARP